MALLTSEQARELTASARYEAVLAVLKDRHVSGSFTCATEVIEAYESIEPVRADRCDQVHERFGQCVRTYGHEGWVERDKYHPEVPGVETFDPVTGARQGVKGMVAAYEETVRDDSAGGHYTSYYEDRRRPDGSHPWDF